MPAVEYADGVATAPDGSFTAAFATSPTHSPSTGGEPERFHVDVDEDAQDVARFGLDAFGATAESTTLDRAQRFVAASGTDVEWLANTPTRLGPDPAAHFIVRLTLGDGRDAVVYGLVVTDATRTTYVFATDIGGDDADRGRDFVSSYTVRLPSPQPVAPTTTTTVPLAPSGPAPSDSPATASTAPAVTSTSPPPAGPTSTGSSGPAGPTAPIGAVVGPGGRWWATFPEGPAVVATATTERGFGATEYRATVGDDTLAVRSWELPAGFEWDGSMPGYEDVTLDGAPVDVDGHPGVAATFADGDATVTALVVVTGSQLVAATYRDAGEDDRPAAERFVDSLGVVG